MVPTAAKGNPVIVSDRKPFVHQGVVYPPGLNRKEYRTIIFNNEEFIDVQGTFKAPQGTMDGEIENSTYDAWLAAESKRQE